MGLLTRNADVIEAASSTRLIIRSNVSTSSPHSASQFLKKILASVVPCASMYSSAPITPGLVTPPAGRGGLPGGGRGVPLTLFVLVAGGALVGLI